MKKNFILIILAVILIFGSLSCASAATSDRYVNVQTGNNSWDGTSPTYISGTTTGPKQSISSGLNVSVNSGNLFIAAGIYKENNLTVGKNLTIIGEGRGNTTVNATGSNLAFYIKSGYKVTIENLTITNGKASSTNYNGNGGAIYNQGNLTLKTVALTNNSAKDGKDADGNDDAKQGGYGGAIYNLGSLTITDCEIKNNHAGKGGAADPGQGHSSHGGYGGAIYNNGNLSIKKTIFKENYAGDGGEGSDVHDGGSGGAGGAIFNDASGTITSILLCSFTGNYAGDGGDGVADSCGGTAGSGGAIYNKNKITSISHTTFDKNHAGYGHHGGSAGSGGAIYNSNSITLQSCYLRGNYAGNGGGTSGGLEGNCAEPGGNGGAIYSTSTATLNYCTITDNHAGKGGNGNSGPKGGAYSGDGGNGGAIYSTSTLTITNCTIKRNTAGTGGDRTAAGLVPGDGGRGGAIYSTNTLKITACTIKDNKAGTGGKSGHFFNKIQLPGGNGGNGGAIYNTSSLTLQNTTLDKNKAGPAGYGYHAGSGGAIYNTGTLNISSCDLNKNEAGNDILNGGSKHGVGCAIYSDTSSNNINITLCSIAGNKATCVTSSKKVQIYHDAVYLKSSSSSKIKMQNNWWGYNNSNNELAGLITGSNSSSSYYTPFYTPWIKLNISATTLNPTATVTISLLNNSNGDNLTSTIPDGSEATFKAQSGSVNPTNATIKNGIASTVFTLKSNSTSGKASAKLDQQTVSVVINPATLDEIVVASSSVKKYYESHHVLPKTVKVGDKTIKMPQLLYLLVNATIKINPLKTHGIEVISVGSAPSPGGYYQRGKLYKTEYLSIAKHILNFINDNNRAPNYAHCSLGHMPFDKLVYIYSKIVNFYGFNNRLPNYVAC